MGKDVVASTSVRRIGRWPRGEADRLRCRLERERTVADSTERVLRVALFEQRDGLGFIDRAGPVGGGDG
jgi:hypothetical protein